MRDGTVTLTGDAAELSIPGVVTAMTGSGLGDARMERTTPPGEPLLRLRGLGAAGRYEGIDLTVRRGEVVALFGLIGSGAGDIALALFGLPPAERGSLELDGATVRIRRPSDARRLGIALLPKDRKSQGIFAPFSIGFNVSMGNLRLLERARVLVDRRRERAVAADAIRDLAIKAPGPDTPVGALSGGNQQKALLARQLLAAPRVLVLDEPTRGVDVAAKHEIHRLILSLADGGTAVVLVTSELPEALRLADRLVVMREGRITGGYEGDAMRADDIMQAAIGTAGNGGG
jgi:rhamnose transport system ATP-binding protein